ncbi:MAG: 4-alpha-glucanotransferase [Candidatus Melainabacteria bacterium]|nr:4-alpha-glucanotransferase [Candidatus Melainabacteria bacterium]
MSGKVDFRNIYEKSLQSTPNGRYFDRYGYSRRSGIAVPAFALYSDKVPIGNYGIAKRMVDFCHETKSGIYQFLPMNCTGFNHCPYSAESGFALDGIYLSLENIKELTRSFNDDVEKLYEKFPIVTGLDGASRVDYRLKKETLAIALQMFRNKDIRDWQNIKEFQEFKNKTAKYWLDNYVLYRALKEYHNEKSWEDWDSKYKNGDEAALKEFISANSEKLEFHRWTQWQLFEQAKELKDYAHDKKNVLLMGDLPFLPSRDSADVWTDFVKKTNYFDLKKQAGALPDMYFAKGQLWGNPVPNWDEMAKDDFKYICEKRRYASNFYHIERKDHEIGQSRLYINDVDAQDGRFGTFLPPGKVGDEKSERNWQAHHRKILLTQIEDPGSTMLYTSEGLGVPPKYMRETLSQMGSLDISVQRWTKNGPVFVDPNPIGISTLATHDCTTFAGWFEKEAGTIDRGMFKNLCEAANIPADRVIDKLFDLSNSSKTRLRWKSGLKGDETELKAIAGLENEFQSTITEKKEFLRFISMFVNPETLVSPEMVKLALEKYALGPAIFDIPTIYDLESMQQEGLEVAVNCRPNTPGIYDPRINWNWRAQRPINKMLLDDKYIEYLRKIHEQSGRT